MKGLNLKVTVAFVLALATAGLMPNAGYAQDKQDQTNEKFADDMTQFEREESEIEKMDLEVENVQWVGASGWTCWATNRRGQSFIGRSHNRNTARRIAMNRCASVSTSCFFRSCR